MFQTLQKSHRANKPKKNGKVNARSFAEHSPTAKKPIDKNFSGGKNGSRLLEERFLLGINSEEVARKWVYTLRWLIQQHQNSSKSK